MIRKVVRNLSSESFNESIIVLDIMPVGAGVVKGLFANGWILAEGDRLCHSLITMGERANMVFSDTRVSQPILTYIFPEVLWHEVDLIETLVETESLLSSYLLVVSMVDDHLMGNVVSPH